MKQFFFLQRPIFRQSHTSLIILLATVLLIPTSSRAGETSLEDLSEDLSRIIHDVSAVVVNISVTADKPASGTNKKIPSHINSPVSKVRRNCQATGFFFDDQGHILTTASVVNEAQSVEVTLVDDRTMQGKIVGFDAQTRIGVIKVEPVPAVIPKFTEQKPRLGSIVLCLGNQAGLQNTPMLGLVSGLDRCLNSVLPSEPVIQITAPISPGMAGAPVINSNGEIVGMVCATYCPADKDNSSLNSPGPSPSIASDAEPPRGSPDDLFYTGSKRRHSREYVLSSNMTIQSMEPRQFMTQEADSDPSSSNVGFAVPISTVREIAAELIANGRISRGWLGIMTIDARDAVPEEVRQHLHLGKNEGVVVRAFVEESPAGEAGFNPGDILLSINGHKVSSSRDVFNLVDELGPGKPVALSIIRDGQYRTLNTTLAERPTNF